MKSTVTLNLYRMIFKSVIVLRHFLEILGVLFLAIYIYVAGKVKCILMNEARQLPKFTRFLLCFLGIVVLIIYLIDCF